MKSLRDKKVLITGASSGIGEALAHECARRGAYVFLVARREDRLKEVSQKLPLSSYIVSDLSTIEGLHEITQVIEENQIDILINNAGRGSFGYFEDQSVDMHSALMTLNAIAPMALSHAFLKHAKKRNSGGIIFVSSVAAFQPLPLMASYSASKAVNLHHALCIREECRGTGVHVTALCPGPVETEFGIVAKVPGSFAGGVSPQSVAEQCIQGFIKNASIVIPGWRAKFYMFASRYLPLSFSIPVVGSMLKRIYRKS